MLSSLTFKLKSKLCNIVSSTDMTITITSIYNGHINNDDVFNLNCVTTITKNL